MSGTDQQLPFDDGKDAGAMRTIGEVAKALDIKPHVLRYWERQFPMLEPLKRSGGRRYYRPSDIALVVTIDRMVNREGYTIKGACQAIARDGASPTADAESEPQAVSHVADASIGSEAPALVELLPQLVAIRNRLARALAI